MWQHRFWLIRFGDVYRIMHFPYANFDFADSVLPPAVAAHVARRPLSRCKLQLPQLSPAGCIFNCPTKMLKEQQQQHCSAVLRLI